MTDEELIEKLAQIIFSDGSNVIAQITARQILDYLTDQELLVGERVGFHCATHEASDWVGTDISTMPQCGLSRRNGDRVLVPVYTARGKA